MAMISFFTAIVGVLALQAANAQVTTPLPYDLSAYTNLLTTAPNYITCDTPWYGYFDVSLYQRMTAIAAQYKLRPGDIAQWYLHVQSLCSSYTDLNLYENLASIYRSEMLSRGIPALPPFHNCNALAEVTPYTLPAAVDPLTAPVSTPEDYAYRNMYSMLSRSIPRLSPNNYASIISQLNSYLPASCLQQNPLLANRIANNMRYSLGMAERMTSGINYPFYEY